MTLNLKYWSTLPSRSPMPASRLHVIIPLNISPSFYITILFQSFCIIWSHIVKYPNHKMICQTYIRNIFYLYRYSLCSFLKYWIILNHIVKHLLNICRQTAHYVEHRMNNEIQKYSHWFIAAFTACPFNFLLNTIC